MMRRLLCLLALTFVAPALGAAEIDFPARAKQLIASNTAADRETVLETLFRLQIVAGDYAGALSALEKLRELRPGGAAANVRWEIYAKAKQIESSSGTAFDAAFASAFRDTMRTLDDKTAYRVIWTFGTSLPMLRNAFQAALAKGTDQVDLVKKYLGAEAYGSFAPFIGDLIAEDDARRYVIQKDLTVTTPDGATICATIVRPRAEGRLPALLNFTIYADPENNLSEVRRTASNGYAGVIGLTRGKGCSGDTPVPYEHDGADAAALVDWIAVQPWSDGRVGMYGGSYEAMPAWGAAKRMPKALKAIMTGAPVAPGVDVPMEGNVFWSFLYPWPFYALNNKTLDNATYNDAKRWRRIDHDWYVSGRPYRELDKIDGTSNPFFDKWLAHPSYDAYWRGMIAYGSEFARIDIPVLTTAGYYYGGPGAAVYYFTEHTRHRPHAEHYLLIGPYDHVRGHSGTLNVLGTKTITNIAGYEIEPVAHVDMKELRYQWFDYVFGRGSKPALLSDKVNYAVVGANRWKHAPSLAAMANGKLKVSLRRNTSLTVDLADRSDVDREVPGGSVIDKAIDTANAVTFSSDPLPAATEVSGLFSGHLDFVTNKRDFDFQVDLYAERPGGDYIQLAPYWTRASYAANREQRRLLRPGKRQRLDFTATRLVSTL